MDGRELIARNVRTLRVRTGMSQRELAERAAVERTYISGLELELENPTIGVLERVAAALGVNISGLFEAIPPVAERPENLRAGRKGSRTIGLKE